ncbi:MAG: HPr family phosphocarrier protein [Lawsonibacter sp.]|jgi:phosphocarrier protein HPr
MQEFAYEIQNPVGLHARPAGGLVKVATELDSVVTLAVGEKCVEATHLFGLLKLGVRKGDVVRVSVSGGAEAANLQTLKEFFQANL